MSMLRRILIAALLPACFACIQRSGGVGAPGTDTNVITREQIYEVDVTNAHTLIERLRPRWLTVRGGPRSFRLETEVVVFQDDMLLGGTDVLRSLGVEGIYRITYLDGATASATLPGMSSRHVAGAIVISMRSPEPGATAGI